MSSADGLALGSIDFISVPLFDGKLDRPVPLCALAIS
jgi:hypothetical protein